MTTAENSTPHIDRYQIRLRIRSDGMVVAKVMDDMTGFLSDSVPRDIRELLASVGYAEEREGVFIKKKEHNDIFITLKTELTDLGFSVYAV